MLSRTLLPLASGKQPPPSGLPCFCFPSVNFLPGSEVKSDTRQGCLGQPPSHQGFLEHGLILIPAVGPHLQLQPGLCFLLPDAVASQRVLRWMLSTEPMAATPVWSVCGSSQYGRPWAASHLSVNLPKLTDTQFILAREKYDLEVTLKAAEPEARYIYIGGREGVSPRSLNRDPVSTVPALLTALRL